jgi:nucleotide-binding universal stress UspA family protein
MLPGTACAAVDQGQAMVDVARRAVDGGQSSNPVAVEDAILHCKESTMYRRILVPIDGSPPAHRGLQEALALARRLDASLVLLHIVEWFPMVVEMASATTWEQINTGLRDQGRDLLDSAHDQAKAIGVAAETYLVDASAALVADVIVEHARVHHCDLIVMGTHGRRGLTHALAGSDAEGVLRTSRVPVLMLRQPDAAAE